MNRWTIQFFSWAIPIEVTAPTAADAMLIAESALRRAQYSYVHDLPKVPYSIKYAGPVSVEGRPAQQAAEPEPEPELPRGPTWKCKLCQKWATAEDLETIHRHEDNPDSVYYVAPVEAPDVVTHACGCVSFKGWVQSKGSDCAVSTHVVGAHVVDGSA